MSHENNFNIEESRAFVAVLVFLIAENQPSDKTHTEDDTPSEQEERRSIEPRQPSALCA